MPFFAPVKNINPILDLTCATTLTVTKGVPVRQASGVVTICATNVLDCIGVAAETHVSGGAATVKVWPAQGKEGTTIFKISNATLDQTSCGVTYLMTVATNNAVISAASTTLGAFYAMTADGTNVWGILSGNAFQGALSLTA